MPVVPLREARTTEATQKGLRRSSTLTLAALSIVTFALFGTESGRALSHNLTQLADPSLPRASSPATPLDAIHCAERAPGQAHEVAVVDFKGNVGGRLDSDGVYGLMNRISGNPRIGGIALRIDSSGGNSYVAKKLNEILVKTKTECHLPMAAFIGNVGTSGGYWMALAADEIHADTLSTVGAVGVIAIYTNESEKQAREGIKHSVIRTGDKKWPLNPYLPVTADDERKIRDSLDLVLIEFMATVQTSRGTRLQLTREELATGEAWMGVEANKLGLTDGPGDLGDVFSRLLGASPTAYRQFDLGKYAATDKSTDD